MQSALEQDPGDMGRHGVVGEEPLAVFGLARVERKPKGRDQDGVEQAIEVPDKLEHQVSNHDLSLLLPGLTSKGFLWHICQDIVC